MDALKFAIKAHGDQKRKYTGEPYINHPIEVAGLIVQCVPDHTADMVNAALLHDVVEDTEHSIQEIEVLFGQIVASLVSDLTDVSKPVDGNRAARKAIDLEHTAKASPQAKTIKLADLISNTSTIVQHDKQFARVYLREKAELLEVLREGNSTLWNRAKRMLEEGLETVK